MMEQLRDSINDLRRQNYQRRSFIPEKALFALIQREQIRKALIDETKPYRLKELTEIVFKGARKIFAILVLNGHTRHLLKFVEADQLQKERLDYKLPISLEWLASLIGESHGRLFYDKQWEFTAPIFSPFVLRRSLEDDTILPFISEKKLNNGGFGDVFLHELDSNHQSFNSTITELVRKELQPHATEYDAELENLSLLKLVRHPHIVELLGCYTYRGSHNFLFPRARSGDLSDLLKLERSDYFGDNSKFLVAVSGLASAISQVHYFAAQEIQLDKIGCHHDIKLGNILVDQNRFILSDFGLSRFKDTTQDSATIFKFRKGYTLAPECQEMESFEKQQVHRSSDIWSFGCILLDVLTYMLLGPQGVSDFCARRRFEVDGTNIYYLFHRGSLLNEGVVSWMEELEKLTSTAERMLLCLIRRMLRISPQSRPDAKLVYSQLSFIALTALSEPIMSKFELVMKEYGSIDTSELAELYIEQKRFHSWIMSLSSQHPESSSVATFDFETLQSIFRLLNTILNELSTIIDEPKNIHNRVFLPLRRLNTGLLDLLSPPIKAKALGIAESLILENQDIQQLDLIQKSSYNQGQESPLSSLAESKKLRLIAEQISAANVGKWDLKKQAKDIKPMGHHFIGSYQDEENNRQSEVLVDYKKYDDPLVRNGLYGRMDGIVALSRSLRSSENINVLECRGYFHAPSIQAFGLIYDFPSRDTPNFVTLQQILFHGIRAQQPILADRFKLAHILAAGVAELHTIGWIHKGICASNIAFFFPSKLDLLSSMQKPYTIGFKHSRAQAAFTEGPLTSDTEKYSQHPEYDIVNRRFSLKYDYYSLGILLLEIGLWKSSEKMGIPEGISPETSREHIRRVLVPRLGQSVGATYRDIVDACLGHVFDECDDLRVEDSRRAALLVRIFETEVVLKLLVLSKYEL